MARLGSVTARAESVAVLGENIVIQTAGSNGKGGSGGDASAEGGGVTGAVTASKCRSSALVEARDGAPPLLRHGIHIALDSYLQLGSLLQDAERNRVIC